MSRPRVALAVLNSLERQAFVDAIGFVFEDSPWITAAGWEQRPFASVAALHQALCEVVEVAGVERQLALIRAHPDLVGRAALAGSLGPESTQEQSQAGLNSLSAEEIAIFQQYNSQYRARFDFPFVICARENKKASILAGFATRLSNTPEQEIASALGEIAKIAGLRLADTVVET